MHHLPSSPGPQPNGEVQLRYDKAGSRPKWSGDLELRYDMLGSRLRAIGDIELTYDTLGSRLKQVGDMELEYDMIGSRPRYILTANDDTQLTGVTLAVLFFVLYECDDESQSS